MVLQSDVVLNPIRFEKPSVKIIFDLLTQKILRQCGHLHKYLCCQLNALLTALTQTQINSVDDLFRASNALFDLRSEEHTSELQSR